MSESSYDAWGSLLGEKGSTAPEVSGPSNIPTITVTAQRPQAQTPKFDPDVLAKKLAEMGYSKAGTAGIMANFQRESKDNPDATGDKGTSFGLAQWHLSRKDDLLAYAEKQHKSPDDPDVQLAFFDQEMRSKYPKLRAALMKSDDPGAAEEMFKRLYERPASVLWTNNRSGQPVIGNDQYRFSPDALKDFDRFGDTPVVLMPPTDYLALSPPLQASGNPRQMGPLRRSVGAGEPVDVLPTLDVDRGGPSGTVTDQDGRHRALLAQEHGLPTIPVAVQGGGAGMTEIEGTRGNVLPFHYPPAAERRGGVLSWLLPSAQATEPDPYAVWGAKVEQPSDSAAADPYASWGSALGSPPSSPAPSTAPSTTLGGLAAAVGRGLAPYAAGAAAGALVGLPEGGIGAIPGAAAGAGMVALGQLGTSVLRPIESWFGVPAADRAATPSGITNHLLDYAGVRPPQTAAERIAEATAEGVGGAAGLGAGSNMLAAAARNPAVRQAMLGLGSDLGLNMAAGGGSAASQQGAAELGFGPLGQFAASLLGGGITVAAVHPLVPIMKWAESAPMAETGPLRGRPGARNVSPLRNNPAMHAIFRRMAHDVKAGGPTAQDMLDVANAVPGKPLTLLDVAGENVRSLGGRMARTPGESRQIMTGALDARDEEAPTRLAEDVDQGIASGSSYTAQKALMELRSATSAPLWDKAMAEPVTMGQARQVQQFLTDPLGQQGFVRGLRILELKALEEGKQFDPTKYGAVRSSDSGKWIIDPDVLAGRKAPSMPLLQAVKRGYDAEISDLRNARLFNSRPTEDEVAIDRVRRSYVTKLRDMFPDYAKALNAWSGPTSSAEAVRLGEKFRLMRPEEIADRMKGMGDNDRQFFKLGVADLLRTALGEKGPQADEAQAIIRNGNARRRLRPLFDTEESYDRFIKSIEAEQKMFETRNHLLRNSLSASRLAEDQSPLNHPAIQAGRAGIELGSGNHLAALSRGVGAVRNYLARPDPELYAAISRILTAPLNQENSAGMNLLRNFGAAAPVTRNYLALPGAAVSALAPFLAPPVPPPDRS